MKNSLQSPKALLNFLAAVLPAEIRSSSTQDYVTRAEFIADVATGMKKAPMAVRLTPHILSLINWKEAYSDPIRRQFIPIASSFKPDHPQLQLDSLHETHDSPVKGLVHRYPDKVLFLGNAIIALGVMY